MKNKSMRWIGIALVILIAVTALVGVVSSPKRALANVPYHIKLMISFDHGESWNPLTDTAVNFKVLGIDHNAMTGGAGVATLLEPNLLDEDWEASMIDGDWAAVYPATLVEHPNPVTVDAETTLYTFYVVPQGEQILVR